MDLHDGETILFQGHPSWRAALLFFGKGLLGAAAVGAIAWLIWGQWTGIVAGLAIFGLVVVGGLFIRQSTEYVITDERLHIRRGLVSRRIQETRLARVQDVTVTQGVFDRLLRIGRADFDTAAEGANDFVFAGIENPDQVRAAVDAAHRLAEQRAVTKGPTNPSGL